MVARTLPIRLDKTGPVAAAALAFRFEGRLELGVTLKAKLEIGPGGATRVVEPDDILTDDVHQLGDPKRPLEAPAELVPWLPRPEILVHGFAYAPNGIATTRSRVRLAVRRGRNRLVEKELFVYGDQGAFTRIGIGYDRALSSPDNPHGRSVAGVLDPASPDETAGFGPLCRTAKRRAALLSAVDAQWVHGGVLDVPATLDDTAFQTAPPSQCLDTIEGDEVVELDGMHPRFPRIEARLPHARATLTIADAADFGDRWGSPFPLRLDSIRIDAEKLACWLVWRGRMPISSPASLSRLVLSAGLTIHGSQVTRVATDDPTQQELHPPAALQGTLPLGADRATTLGPSNALLSTLRISGKPAHDIGTAPTQVAPAASPLEDEPTSLDDLDPVEPMGASKTKVLTAPPDDVRDGPLASTANESDPATNDLPFERPAEDSRHAHTRNDAPIAGAPWSGVTAPAAPLADRASTTLDLDPALFTAMREAAPGGKQSALEQEHGLEAYIKVRARIAAAPDPAAALHGLGIDPDEWARIDRTWRRRALTDPAIAKRLEDTFGTAK